MSTQDLTITLLVDQTPEEAFKAINNVRGWWGEGIKGGTENLNDEFIYRHEDIHYSKHKLIEVVPAKRVVWLTTESTLTFIEDTHEWVGTKVVFDISTKGDKTQVRFTHQGLTPSVECYDACNEGWNYYIKSLYSLITTGKGHPDAKEKAATETMN
ncbi:MAG TPA: SRPBCC domain-containing protein [Chitinophagaceae bacterium]